MSHKKQQSEDIFTALIHSYNTLTRSETKVADYILRHKQEIHLQSISELAQRCSVENSMARLLHCSLSWMSSER